MVSIPRKSVYGIETKATEGSQSVVPWKNVPSEFHANERERGARRDVRD